MKLIRHNLGFVLSLLFIALLGCSTSVETRKKQLHIIAKSDLEDILNELSLKGIDSVKSKNPRYEIVIFKAFTGDTARVFSAFAEVHYFYYKKLKFYQTRKYRYSKLRKGWDRFDMKLKYWIDTKKYGFKSDDKKEKEKTDKSKNVNKK